MLHMFGAGMTAPKLSVNKSNIIIECSFGNGFRFATEIIIGTRTNRSKAKNIFSTLSLTKVEFDKFFIPEVLWTFKKLLEQKKSIKLNRPGIQESIKLLEDYNRRNSNFKVDYKKIEENLDFRILTHQLPIFERYEYFKRECGYRGILMDAEPGTGKAQPYDSKILTPIGFTPLKFIRKGSKVVTPDGSISTVLDVFPQGEMDIYRVRTKDGRRASCCLEHLWLVRVDDGKPEVMDTYTIKLLLHEEGRTVKIPTLRSIVERDNLRSDIEAFTKLGEHIRHRKSTQGCGVDINRLGLVDKMPVKDKLALFKALSGENLSLGDTFSFAIEKNGGNNSDFVKFLSRCVFSMGGTVEKEVVDNYYYITARFDETWIELKSVVYYRTEKCACIKIDHPARLYITNGYMVTHNTFSSLALAEGSNCDTVFIVCPLPTVNRVWTSSISGGPGDCVFKKPREYYTFADGGEYKNEKYVVIHYEAIGKALEMFAKTKFTNSCVIIDESHNLADIGSNRTRACIELVNMLDTDNVFCLSGTPLKSSFIELVVLYYFIYKDFNPKLENKFLNIYRSPNEYFKELLTSRYQGLSVKVKKESIGLKELNTYTLSVKLANGDDYTLEKIREDIVKFVERRKKELEEQFPYWENVYKSLLKKVVEDHANDFKEKDILEYKRIVEDIRKAKNLMFFKTETLIFVKQFEDRVASILRLEEKKLFREAKTIYKYPILKIQGEALGIVVTGARIKCHSDLANAIKYKSILLNTTKKTIIFSSYINICQNAFNKCVKEGFKPIDVFGETSKDLTKNVKLFTDNKKFNPLVATYKSLGTGVPLIAANTVICIDLPFRLYMYDQAISRVWRLGQDTEVTVYLVKLDTGDKPNINGRTADIMEFFKREIEEITGYKSNIDTDFYNEDKTMEQETGETSGITSKKIMPDLVSELVIANESMEPTKLFYCDKLAKKNKSYLLDNDSSKFNLVYEWLNGGIKDGDESTSNRVDNI